jgi:NADH-quinone oxidoreductase subunit E
MGAVASATEASRRVFAPVLDKAPDAVKKPAAKAGRAARAIIDEAQSLAQEIGEKAEAGVAAAVEQTVAVEAAVAEAVQAFVQPKAIARPETPDDLKLISGIGPKLEQVLNGLGVWTFAQIADWSAQEIGWVDDYLSFKGRIGRDGWLEQARAKIGQGG